MYHFVAFVSLLIAAAQLKAYGAASLEDITSVLLFHLKATLVAEDVWTKRTLSLLLAHITTMMTGFSACGLEGVNGLAISHPFILSGCSKFLRHLLS